MKIRIITAIIAILLFFPLVIIGGLPFKLIMFVIGSIGLLELLQMRKMTRFPIPTIFSFILLWVLLLQVNQESFFLQFKIDNSEIMLLIVLVLLGYTVLVKNKLTFEDAGFIVISAIYVGLGFYYFMETREIGLEYIFYGIVIILATDTGAYFCGKAFGKRKLWPEISPNKTIEGAIGGIVLACIVAVIFQLIFPVHSSMFVVLIVTVFASMFGQVGDLVESAFKRYYDVKDSGKLLPGHGGILDRFDSWLFVFPFLHFIQFVS
ncbi:phosphatidate cytidylyltransferase [Paraliobacillus quinghaiensis]|uniref:Phosphatidate cytidylyltransferase n=1 Tax=Paraliobacillus quinghaiensis TaxID=470815 RepID=A0A917TI36_9BACI|nr:phosphatidate cytidylyltransferase [Paraliobacillus quinghaiensis]GGM21660.1 phosphatidate cytidylyltransferase [Paraliobacillus quinghaiensis]